jgi:hypothetical protein
MTTTGVDLDQALAAVRAEVAQGVAEDGEHPDITCGTCFAVVQLIDVENPPKTNACLGASGSPRQCNTWAMRHRAGIDKQIVTTEYHGD